MHDYLFKPHRLYLKLFTTVEIICEICVLFVVVANYANYANYVNYVNYVASPIVLYCRFVYMWIII